MGRLSLSCIVGLLCLEAHFTQAKPFSLVYVVEEIVRIKIMVLSARLALLRYLIPMNASMM